MTTYVLRRIGVGVGLVLLVLTLIFLALHLVPGDPAMLLLSQGDGGSATPEAVARVREQLGLDEPLLTQYWQFLSGALTGDLGESFRNGQAVSEAIGERLPGRSSSSAWPPSSRSSSACRGARWRPARAAGSTPSPRS
ncbi:hypothetical protein [Nocardioides zeae]